MPGKAKEDKRLTQKQEIAQKKLDFLEYYEDLPIKQAAADHVSRDLDTIKRWENDDSKFAEAMLKAKAEFALKHCKRRPDSLLPKLYPELKPDAVEIALPTAITITHVHAINNDQPNDQTG